jgi:NAD(P)-dependent dehydrogenase (short-subunit alcohol dehydrogenase family)
MHGLSCWQDQPLCPSILWNDGCSFREAVENRPLGEKKRLVGDAVPYGRMGRPEDHAGAPVLLASDDAEYIVAQALNVDGGNWMS